MHNGAKARAAWGAALAAGMTLAGCGGGGGGSAGPAATTPATSPTTTVTNPPATNPPTSTPSPPSVRQALAGKSLVLKAARGAAAGHARSRPAVRVRGHVVDVTADVIEEVLVFADDGTPDPAQSKVVDLTNPAGATVTALSVSDAGVFSETALFAGTGETDTITGTLVPAAGGAGATLQNGADSLVVGAAAPVVLPLPLAGPTEGGGGAVDPTAFGVAPGTYIGTVAALDGSGAALAGPVLGMTVNTDASFQGGLTYTDGAGAAQSQVVFGQLDPAGDYFGTLAGDAAQPFSEQVSVAAGPAGAVTVSGVVLDGTGALVLSYAGTLTPGPAPTRRRR